MCCKVDAGSNTHLWHARRQNTHQKRHRGAHVAAAKGTCDERRYAETIEGNKDARGNNGFRGERGAYAVMEGGRIGMKICSHFRGKSSCRRPNTQEERRLGDAEVTMTRRSMRRPWGRVRSTRRQETTAIKMQTSPCITDIKRCTGTFSIKSCTLLSARPPLKLLIHGTEIRPLPLSQEGRSIPSVIARCMSHDLE
jgi:hypothetical protein